MVETSTNPPRKSSERDRNSTAHLSISTFGKAHQKMDVASVTYRRLPPTKVMRLTYHNFQLATLY